MNQTVKTSLFAGVALLAAAIAYGTRTAFTPADIDAFSDVGTEFYPDFKDPNEATGLRVVSFNDETGKTDQFSVEFKDGLWRIPSHHDYPADGKEQLAKTAASMIGVERSALVERTKAAHKRYNLLDPMDSDVSGTEGRGDRITLTKGDETLADFIVGKKVEDQENVYYVRSAGEDRFYTADLGDFKISTKFADWIQKDILDINRNDVRELFIDRYHVDEASGTIVPGEQITLNRDSGQGEWKLTDLNAETEKVNTSNINTMLLALDDLAIVGVRPKPDGLSSGLKSEDGAVKANPLEYQLIRADLQQRGFFMVPQMGIVSNEGEVHVGTSEGVLYVLRFGEEFSGSDVDIEVGKQGDPSEDQAEEKADNENEKTTAESSDADDDGKDALKKSRYLFVSTQFDEQLLGAKPTAPVKPEPPAEGEQPAADAAEKTEAAADAPAADSNVDADAAEQETSEEAKPDPKKQYEDALAKYEEDLEVFKIAEAKYNENIDTGKKRVAELNRRFADWYYVISADVFDRMKLNRTDIVSPKDPPKEEGEGATSPANPLDTLTNPGGAPSGAETSIPDAGAPIEAGSPAGESIPAENAETPEPEPAKEPVEPPSAPTEPMPDSTESPAEAPEDPKPEASGEGLSAETDTPAPDAKESEQEPAADSPSPAPE